MLAWLSVWNEVLLICIFAGTTATPSSLASLKPKIVYVLVQRTQVVLKYLDTVKRVLLSLCSTLAGKTRPWLATHSGSMIFSYQATTLGDMFQNVFFLYLYAVVMLINFSREPVGTM